MKKSLFSISTEVKRGDVIITNGLVGILKEDNEFKGYRARILWDTGATNSTISEKLAAKLPLQYLRHHNVETAHGGDVSLAGYSNVSFMLVDGTAITPYATDVSDLNGQSMDAVVGMDIISQGTFTLEPTDDGGTRMTFTLYEQ